MKNPFKKFDNWFTYAKKKCTEDHTAFALATIDSRNQPHCRMVLLKKVKKDGFIFFTNLNSNKGKQFLKNNKLAMCFYWHSIDRQIRIIGKGTLIKNKQSDEYFSTRLRGSQIGAWASNQSTRIKSRDQLVEKIAFYKQKFHGKKVPRPNYWQGIKIVPSEFEFWKQGKYRLHDRSLFYLESNSWKVRKLSP